jgi:deoxyribonuclease V
MMPDPLHEWDVSPAQAAAIQRALAPRLIDQPLPLESVRLVAGVDVSVRPDADGHSLSRAAIAVLTFPELRLVETAAALQPTRFPYIPGLLAFREGPVVLEAYQRLRTLPDVLIFDGMGRAHPRRMGIAAHLGLWLDRPTIGCGKSWLIGEYDPPAPERGAWSPLRDRGEVIGAALRTRAHVSPVFVSPGHRCDLASAIALTLACTTRYRLPETTRAAHRAAGDF